MQIIKIPVRILAVIFSAIVLALSVVLAKGQVAGHVPALTGFVAFCGGFGIVVVAIGVAADFLEAFPSLIMVAIDGLCTLFYLAGSIALAVKLGVHSCEPDTKGFSDLDIKGASKKASLYLIENPIINAGVGYTVNFDWTSRCREAQADTAFLFFAFACFATSTALDFFGNGGSGFSMPRRRGGGGGGGSTSYV